MAELVHKLNLQSLTLKVRLPRALPARIWLGSKLIMLAARIIGCGVVIETQVGE